MHPTTTPLFEFDYSPAPETFIIQLTDVKKIAHARRIVSGEEKSKIHVSGTIVKTPQAYNPPWKFHLDPQSISFFEFAVEVCDASIKYVADHLDDVGGAFLPNS